MITVATVATAVGLAWVSLGAAATAATPTCFGKRATIVGTAKSDHLSGTPRADVIEGLGGNDTINGLGGNDLICGGPGNDRLNGGAGRDRIDGGPGTNTCVGETRVHCGVAPPPPGPGGGGVGDTGGDGGPCGIARSSFSSFGEGQVDAQYFVPPAGTTRGLMLFVDFPDAPGSGSTTGIANSMIGPAHEWYRDASYGRLDLQVATVDRWFRMPQAASAYANGYGLVDDVQKYIADALAAADAAVDFSKYDFVYIVPPAGAAITRSEAGIPWAGYHGPIADGKELRFGVPFGSDVEKYSTYAWTILAHETGHLFGLPDLYDTSSGTYPDWERWVGAWDPMSDNWLGQELNAWHRYKLGWLESNQVACIKTAGTSDVVVTPVELSGGVKAIVVPNGSSDIVAEVRRPIGYDAKICSSGVLVYTVDQFAISGQGPIRITPAHPDTDSNRVLACGALADAPFDVGGVAEVAGVRFEILSTDGSAYTIRVTRP
ncbi:MAG TPA: M6 family metalloprotease domain-containing protein [Gaiellaceae bacterium]|jgi:M6 family metalloprotease-like protein|nr:M6 family metalloprotease domain-containing protein [Gaiellaceae bacterium]